jgi:voltage-gated potassium channel
MDDRPRWRRRLHEIVFEADTRAGRTFDATVLAAILLSVAAVLLESIPEIRRDYGPALHAIEWVFTLLFTVEYALRLLSVDRPLRYAASFLGIVDLLAFLPTYLAALFPAAQSLLVLRAVRLLRIFRVLKLARFLEDAEQLLRALRASRRKITVFFGGLLTVVLIVGTLMYLIEGEEHGFTSIPRSMYWAVVTMTTVGYGDIVPRTGLGRLLSAVVMILGYSIIAVPTGIVSVELSQSRRVSTQHCPSCATYGHDPDARHCKHCGAAL